MQFAALPALNKSKISEASETRDAHKKVYNPNGYLEMDIFYVFLIKYDFTN